MKITRSNSQKAGFGVRFAAAWIDLFLVWSAVKIIIKLFNNADIYVPFELTFGVFFLFYSILLIGMIGSTIGKSLCGLVIRTPTGKPFGFVRVLVRETICKAISVAFLFLGFLWIGFSKKKRGWHDYLAGTIVLQKSQSRKKAVLFELIVFTICVFWMVNRAPDIWRLYSDIRVMAPASDIKMPYEQREVSSTIDISSLDEQDYTRFIDWLDTHGKNPPTYAVETAARHQVTIFGEVHEKKDYLVFFNGIIGELYHKAGVTCVAMEVCLAEDNEKIEQLVTAPEFDKALAMEIARHQSWGIWGFKEYWDIFEAVWRLNTSLSEGREKMHLVGIDAKSDFPSVALVTGGESAKIKAPIYEKLRIFRIIDDMIELINRDAIMARNVEKEIIEKGRRGVVWIGYNHSFPEYQQPIFIKGKLVRKFNRMGLMLHQKYGDEIYQVALHQPMEPVMKNFIEPVMVKRGNEPVGFDVADSPFANLRDSDSEDYGYFPGLSFADKAFGYIYLKPFRKLEKCEWLEGYVSTKMFLDNKPYYKAWAELVDKEVDNAKEADEAVKYLFEQP